MSRRHCITRIAALTLCLAPLLAWPPLSLAFNAGGLDLSRVEMPEDGLVPASDEAEPKPVPADLLVGSVIGQGAGSGKALTGALLHKGPGARTPILSVVPADFRVLVDRARSKGGWYAVAVVDFPSRIKRGFMRKKRVRLIDLRRPYTDVYKEHWAFPAIRELTQEGLLQGSAGRYLGNKPFSRYELAVVAARLVRKLRYARLRIEERLRAVERRPTARTRRREPQRRARRPMIDSAQGAELRALSKRVATLESLSNRLSRIIKDIRLRGSVSSSSASPRPSIRRTEAGPSKKKRTPGLLYALNRIKDVEKRFDALVPALARTERVDGLLAALAIDRQVMASLGQSMKSVQTRMAAIESKVRRLSRRR